MNVRIGNQTSAHAPAKLPYEFACRNGFDAFEWFSDRGRHGWCEAETSPAECDQLHQAAAAGNVRFSIHAPYYADPTTPDGIEAIRKSIRFGGSIKASVVNLHHFPQYHAKVYAESLKPLIEEAAKAGLQLSLENTPETPPDNINAVFGVLSAMPEATGRVGFCLDSGHANLHSGTRHDYVRFVDLLGNHVPIIHWHAHENWGDRDSHLPLFTGPSAKDDRGLRGLIRRLKQRGFAGSVILEQWPNPPEQLVKSRNRLTELLGQA
ncbi:MAG: sugar phosphate isomerase/epimerase [Planctomycetes bacterium]|nr:sugar phosphate isomerase/epimerase [Planctomycetota bacterium]